MTLESQVVSLELAKLLKELGVKQDAYFSWRDDKKDGWTLVWPWNKGREYFSAFTVAELGEMLPENLNITSMRFPNNRWQTIIDLDEDSYKSHSEGDNEVDARAKMLIHLLENKLI